MKKMLFIHTHSAPYREPVMDELRKDRTYDMDIVYLYGDGVLCHPEWNFSHAEVPVVPHKQISLFGKKFDWHSGLLGIVPRYDIIFVNGYFPLVNLLVLLKALRIKKKVIFSCDTMVFKMDGFHRAVYHFVRKSTLFFVPGARTKNALAHQLGIPEHRIFQESYLLDSVAFYNAVNEQKKHLVKNKDSFILLFVGKLRRMRNIPLLMSVIAELHQRNPNISLVFIGNGDCYKKSLDLQISGGGY